MVQLAQVYQAADRAHRTARSRTCSTNTDCPLSVLIPKGVKLQSRLPIDRAAALCCVIGLTHSCSPPIQLQPGARVGGQGKLLKRRCARNAAPATLTQPLPGEACPQHSVR